MVTGVIRIFLVPGTQRHEGLAADAATFSGDHFSVTGWLCEAKAKSCPSQIHLFFQKPQNLCWQKLSITAECSSSAVTSLKEELGVGLDSVSISSLW